MKNVMKIIAVLTAAILVVACSPKSDQATGTSSPKEFDVALLEGFWWLDPAHDRYPLFRILDDSLYYTEDPENPYSVSIAGDTIIFSQQGLLTKFRLLELSKQHLMYTDDALGDTVQLSRANITDR